LILAAALRVRQDARLNPMDVESCFPGIRVGDALANLDAVAYSTHIVLNPPFNPIPTPIAIDWSSGQVSAASVFLGSILAMCVSGTNIAAILPDVLRSGSRYSKWRAEIMRQATVERIAIWGLFDPWADVDVFLLEAVVGREASAKPTVNWEVCTEKQTVVTIGTKTKVSVGPLVPHRHTNGGRWHPYLHAQGLTRWAKVDASSLPRKRFAGTTFSPPFVVVRRTSRPVDVGRAVGTLILGDTPVAVENHLIVIKPNDASIETCERVLKVLQNEKTDGWLNNRIRCRHLTVSALGELPWWDA